VLAAGKIHTQPIAAAQEADDPFGRFLGFLHKDCPLIAGKPYFSGLI
jgi:hypothetical protein